MPTINPNNFQLPVTPSASKALSTAKNTEPNTKLAATPFASSEAEISDQAKILLSLYTSAGDYVKSEYMGPYPGQINGNSPPSAYVNVEKYNSYLFDKAATDMVATAEKLGLSLDKADVLAQLRNDNSEIASITFNNHDRLDKLGPANAFSDLTVADMDNFTAVYITAKENGLNMADVGAMALGRGIQNRYAHTEVGGDIFPYGWDFSETDEKKITAAKNFFPASVTEKAEAIRNKLQGDLGLGSDFVQYLLDPRFGLRSATDASLDFLSALVDIYNRQDHSVVAAGSSPVEER